MSPAVLYSATPMGQLMKQFDPSFDDRFMGAVPRWPVRDNMR